MGLFSWVGSAVNKVISPIVGTLGSGIGQATGATGLGDASAASIAAQERMHKESLDFEREKLEAIKTASTEGVQTGAGTVSPLASRPTSETAKKPLSPVLIGLAIAGFFLFKKKRGKL